MSIQLDFLIVSSCPEAWGGSEELWAQAAILLRQANHRVHVAKTNVDYRHPRIQALVAAGCTMTDLHQLPPLLVRLGNRLLPVRWQHHTQQRGQQRLKQLLRSFRPALTLVAQGNNFDGVGFADVCRRGGYPYALVAQKAVHFLFPYDWERSRIQAVYQAAQMCFFVSRHNLELTQQQIGRALPKAVVVWNPVNTRLLEAFNSPELPLPVSWRPIRLACVARLDLFDKGQDLLLTVLARPKWRSRPIQLTLYGAGPHQQGILELVQLLHLEDRVELAGYAADPVTIWQTHQALILPSRSEGLPLALIEAMLCGRPAIATDAGGVAELLVDNVTGFLAAGTTADAIDQALERAWERQDEWAQIGQTAARHVRATVPADAAARFSTQLFDLAQCAITDNSVSV
ncbi:glycosyltransferase family 4 protein [Fibrivirga algicola]|uniref:Glycosyltransferase family 4 protein n=1 Tax=Fibrivirga algicola TaxID=2950420 RepID=A0ABX0QE80_9BACT|nr:glycosyltransferase family 4 protein [Fibrivirga algicola]NID09525.1 glycosyltransferase family 4 protein [Fibrivirga algicola]